MELKFSRHFLALLAVIAMLFCVDSNAMARPANASPVGYGQNILEANMNCCPKTANQTGRNCANFCTPIQAKFIDFSHATIVYLISFEMENIELTGLTIEPAIPPPRDIPL